LAASSFILHPRSADPLAPDCRQSARPKKKHFEIEMFNSGTLTRLGGMMELPVDFGDWLFLN
jgi:hypothetical protein